MLTLSADFLPPWCWPQSMSSLDSCVCRVLLPALTNSAVLNVSVRTCPDWIPCVHMPGRRPLLQPTQPTLSPLPWLLMRA